MDTNNLFRHPQMQANVGANTPKNILTWWLKKEGGTVYSQLPLSLNLSGVLKKSLITSLWKGLLAEKDSTGAGDSPDRATSRRGINVYDTAYRWKSNWKNGRWAWKIQYQERRRVIPTWPSPTIFHHCVSSHTSGKHILLKISGLFPLWMQTRK